MLLELDHVDKRKMRSSKWFPTAEGNSVLSYSGISCIPKEETPMYSCYDIIKIGC